MDISAAKAYFSPRNWTVLSHYGVGYITAKNGVTNDTFDGLLVDFTALFTNGQPIQGAPLINYSELGYLDGEYLFDGMSGLWLSKERFKHSVTLNTLATTATLSHLPVPAEGLFLESLDSSVLVSGVGSWAYKVKWVTVENVATDITSVDPADELDGYYFRHNQVINLPTDPNAVSLTFRAEEVSGAATLNGAITLNYRRLLS